jgi:hypothetical protein
MASFRCDCGRAIPDELIVRLLKEHIVLACSECDKKLSRSVLLDAGLHCPTCDAHLKRYHRPLNAGMARSLFGLWSLSYHQPDEDWWHHSQFDKGREVHKLKWWGLVEAKPSDGTTDKKASGYWRITEAGKQFAAGYTKVRSTAVVYKNKVEGLEGDEITIREALDSKFNYGQLMTAHETMKLSPSTGKKRKRPRPVAK